MSSPANPAAPAAAAPAAAGETPVDLAQALETLSVNEDPTLNSGELIVRQAGKKHGEPCDVAKVKSFADLPIRDEIKLAVSNKGWQTMSKIQQTAIPLFLSDPPRHMVAQAQAGTGKTGTFVVAALGRMDSAFLQVPMEERLNQPQVIILAITQELVTQIASVVNQLGNDLGVHARRVMSDKQYVDKQQQQQPAQRGRGGAGRSDKPGAPRADWILERGDSFQEQVIVGTPAKVKSMLLAFERQQLPYIDASHVKVLIVDEADEAISSFGPDCSEVARCMPKACQFGLFSATYREQVKKDVHKFVGNDPNLFHEIVLHKKDLTLDKVDNFFVLIGSESDTIDQVYQKKFQAVLDIWESVANANFTGQSMIFVSRKERAQELANFLRNNGAPAVGQIHGDMEKIERELVFQEFVENKRPALVATNVLSRGIDNPNVILVINVDLPETREGVPDADNFVHRIGRSGRWTRRGASISLVAANNQFRDKPILKEIERKLFVDVDRPLTLVQEPRLVGEAMQRANAARTAATAAKQ